MTPVAEPSNADIMNILQVMMQQMCNKEDVGLGHLGSSHHSQKGPKVYGVLISSGFFH